MLGCMDVFSELCTEIINDNENVNENFHLKGKSTSALTSTLKAQSKSQIMKKTKKTILISVAVVITLIAANVVYWITSDIKQGSITVPLFAPAIFTQHKQTNWIYIE